MTKKLWLSLLVGVLSLTTTSEASACIIAPERVHFSFREAIADAEWIAIAEMDSFERVYDWGDIPIGDYQMRTTECLKGRCPETFVQRGISPPASETSTASELVGVIFDATDFWGTQERYGVFPNCEIYPLIVPEQPFLIFGPADYSVGFEPLVDGDERWLDFVRRELAALPTNIPAAD